MECILTPPGKYGWTPHVSASQTDHGILTPSSVFAWPSLSPWLCQCAVTAAARQLHGRPHIAANGDRMVKILNDFFDPSGDVATATKFCWFSWTVVAGRRRLVAQPGGLTLSFEHLAVWASEHRGTWGQLNPLENGWKSKKRKHAKKSSFLCLCYILTAIRAGRCRERRYADHIIYLFRYTSECTIS